MLIQTNLVNPVKNPLFYSRITHMTVQTPVTLSSHAMATRFELVLYGDDPARLRGAGEEALREIERLEAQLSFYLADSEIRWINTHASTGPVKIEPRLFRLLKDCARLTGLTDGAFDITVGPLMRAWRFVNETGRRPEALELQTARSVVGIDHIRFDEDNFTLEFDRPGVEIDLGAYGKGYAIERAIEILREAGVASALMHGGTSSVSTIGAPPGSKAWRISLSAPLVSDDRAEIISLVDNSLSVSAVHGRSFTAEGQTFGHVIDPGTGESTSHAVAAAAVGASAPVCEAVSTSLLVSGPGWLSTMKERFPGYGAVIAFANERGEIEIVHVEPDQLPLLD